MLRLWVCMNVTHKAVKYTDDKDSLWPDAHIVRQVELEDRMDLHNRMVILEKNGYHVTIEYADYCYETRT